MWSAECVDKLRTAADVELWPHHVVEIGPDGLEELAVLHPLHQIICLALVLHPTSGLVGEYPDLLMRPRQISQLRGPTSEYRLPELTLVSICPPLSAA
jgi:hypothetical protein